jgi:hypothetical protein
MKWLKRESSYIHKAGPLTIVLLPVESGYLVQVVAHPLLSAKTIGQKDSLPRAKQYAKQYLVELSIGLLTVMLNSLRYLEQDKD